MRNSFSAGASLSLLLLALAPTAGASATINSWMLATEAYTSSVGSAAGGTTETDTSPSFPASTSQSPSWTVYIGPPLYYLTTDASTTYDFYSAGSALHFHTTFSDQLPALPYAADVGVGGKHTATIEFTIDQAYYADISGTFSAQSLNYLSPYTLSASVSNTVTGRGYSSSQSGFVNQGTGDRTPTALTLDLRNGTLDPSQFLMPAGTYYFSYLADISEYDSGNFPAQTLSGGVSLDLTPLPEPAAMSLTGVASIALLLRRRRSRHEPSIPSFHVVS